MLACRRRVVNRFVMSLTEVMQEIDTLTPAERLKVQAYLIHLRRKDDPSHRDELKRRVDRLQAGEGATEDDLRRRLKPLPGEAG